MLFRSLRQRFQKTNKELIAAAKDGQKEVVRVLLDYKGADVHTSHDLALRQAALNGHTETVQILLDRGADVHAQKDEALRSAAKHGHTKTLRVLEKAANQTVQPPRT